MNFNYTVAVGRAGGQPSPPAQTANPAQPPSPAPQPGPPAQPPSPGPQPNLPVSLAFFYTLLGWGAGLAAGRLVCWAGLGLWASGVDWQAWLPGKLSSWANQLPCTRPPCLYI